MATTLENGIRGNPSLCSQTVVTHSWFKNKLSHSLCHKSYVLGGQRKYPALLLFLTAAHRVVIFFLKNSSYIQAWIIFRHEVRCKERKGKDKEQDTYTVSAVKVQFCSSLPQLPQGGLQKSLLLEEMPRALRSWLLLLWDSSSYSSMTVLTWDHRVLSSKALVVLKSKLTSCLGQ